MGGRSSRRERNSGETVSEFLQRAVGANDRIYVSANDMEGFSGTRDELMENSRFQRNMANMYFGGFSFGSNGEIRINATSDSETVRRKYNNSNRRGNR